MRAADYIAVSIGGGSVRSDQWVMAALMQNGQARHRQARSRGAVMIAMALAAVLTAQPAPSRPYDLVVYGGTAGGVITAVAAAREGLDVALLEPGAHLGGMVTGGRGWTDY